MSAFVLIFFMTVVLFFLICLAFVWAVNNKQYQDLEAESSRILKEYESTANKKYLEKE